MRRFVVIVIFILVASVVKGQTPTFTFQCVCDYLTAADSTCDICNTTTQSRFFKGLLIYKNGVAHKWIEQPYTIIQNFDALTFRELIPGAETIRIELRGTAFDSIAQFRDSVLCPCSGTSTGTTLIAGPGVNIWNDTIAAIPQQIDTFDLVSGTADTIRISLTRDSVPYHYVILPPDSDNQYIDTLQLTGTTLEISLSGDGQPLKTVDLSSLVADGDETIVTAGTGISVTGIGTAGNPYVITNTGDLSNTNELQNLFDTIAVAGQQSIVPNSQHTKLTLIEGVGVTITTDSTAREITIEADTSLLATVNDIDVITLADSAELKAYTGIARGVVLRQQGREGLFTRTTTSRAHDGYMVFEDAAARKWVRITEDDVLNVKWFGAIGNGVADDYYAIQRAIDYTIYEDTTIKKVFIPSGNYLVSRTIHMGYGSAYSSVSLVGDGTPTFRGEQQYNGATITVNFSNAPALNIQGARNSAIDNITFIGLNEITGYLTDTSASNLSNWIYSGLDTIGDNRYTPYAAITVDAYAGGAPSPAYPNVLFPSYTGISTQYSKLSSSQVKIRNVHIYKFTAGIVIKPNADNNGDFVQIEKAIIERVAYGISIGNSQARNTRISDSYIDAHTCITNSKHGAQIGRISVIENVHFGGYQWFDLGAPAYLEGLEINDCYGESFQWIGSIGVGTVGAFPAITFNGCKFQASAIINRILTPTANLTGNAVYNFNHCSFQGNRLYVFENDQAALINFNQCNFGSYPGLGEPGDTAQTYHTQYYRGFDFIIAPNMTSVHVNQCRFHEISNTAGGSLYPAMKGDNTALSTDISYGNFWAKSNLDGSDVQFADLGFISTTNTLTAFTGGVSLTDRAFQGTSSSNFQQGIGTGDLLLFQYNNNTLPVVVTSVSGLVIQGQIMSGYAYNSGGAYTYMLQDTNISTGLVRHFSSRKLLNKKTVFGDFVSGSRIVTNVSYLFDNSDAADELLVSTPLLNADGYLNAIPSPVTVATYIDSLISSTSFRISANATKTGRYEIRNCFLGTNDLAEQDFVYGNGTATQVAWWKTSTTISGKNELWFDTLNIRLGIGYNAPATPLQIGSNVAGNDYIQMNNSSSGNPLLRMFNTGIQDGQMTVKQFTLDATYPGFSLNTNLEVNGRILTSAEFGAPGLNSLGSGVSYNQSTPGGALRLRPVSGASSYINFVENGVAFRGSMGFANGSADFTMRMGAQNFTDGTERFRFTGAGRLGIATNNPQRALHVEGEARITDLTTDVPTQLVGADADGDLGAVALTGLTITGGTLIANDTSATNEAWTIDADDADTELITNQTVKFEGAGTVTTDYNPGTNTLLITGTSAAGLNGIYGDGTATSGNDTLPPGGTTVTIPGQWQPLQFNANTAGGEVWSALVVNAATCSDDRFTKALVLKSPSDSLEVYNYDCGAIIKETGGILTLETDRELWLIGDSINATTIPTRTVLPFLVGQSAAGWLQKIEGTTTGQVPVWDEPNGWWELGSAGGSGTVTGSGAAGQMAYWDGTTSIAGENNHWWDATNDRLGVGTNGGSVSSRVDVTTNSLGTSQTTTSGLAVVNTTAAAAGAQQISPAIRWSGAGWKTTATAASQAVEFRSYVTPVQGTTAPTGYLGFGSAINGSWTNDQFNINSGGEVGIGTTTFTGAGAFARLNVTGSSATVAPYLINAFTASSSGGTVYAQISNTQTASTTFLSLGEAADINAIKAGLRRYGSTHATLPNQLDLVNVGSAAVTLSTNLTVRMTVAADGTVHATNKLAAGFSSTTGIHSTLQTAGSFAGARLETVAAPTFDATKHTVIYTASTNVSWTLPSAASCACDGRVYILHHAGTAGTITLSQTITKGNAGNFNTLTAGQWAYITYGAASIRGYKITSL